MGNNTTNDKVDILVLDFGAPNQMISARLKNLNINFIVAPWNLTAKQIADINPKGVIMSGSGASVLDLDSPKPVEKLYEMGIPILGICYGFQVMSDQLGGQIVHSEIPEFGLAEVSITGECDIVPEHLKEFNAWFIHSDSIDALPPGFQILGHSEYNKIAIAWDPEKKFYGTLFHPERIDMAAEAAIMIDLFVKDIALRGGFAKSEHVDNANEKTFTEIRTHIENLDVDATEVLDLSGKNLKILPPQIARLRELKRLILNGNQLTVLPPQIGNLTKLTYLAIYGGQLKELPPEIGNLRGLKYLAVYGNQLQFLTPEIGKLTQLQTLALDNNQLTTLPCEIGRLSNLMWLHLGFNQLATLPSEIGSLKSLRLLNIRHNQIKELPPEIGSLSDLMSLEIGYNQLTKLPKEIGNLTSLIRLSIPCNQLIELPEEVGRLKKIMFIRLENNQLKSLPREFCDFPQLQILYLSGNKNLVNNVEVLQMLEKIRNKGTKVLI